MMLIVLVGVVLVILFLWLGSWGGVYNVLLVLVVVGLVMVLMLWYI